MKRKSMAEIRAEERIAGFNMCLEIMRREWRATVRLTPDGAVGDDRLFRIFEKMDALGGLLDDDYKAEMFPRVFPKSDWSRLRRRVRLVKPHPHAGRLGFVLDAEAFKTEEGMWRVWFLDNCDGRTDNAYAKPEHWTWVDKKRGAK